MTNQHIQKRGKKSGEWVTCTAQTQCRNGGQHITTQELQATQKWAEQILGKKVALKNIPQDLLQEHEKFENDIAETISKNYDKNVYDNTAKDFKILQKDPTILKYFIEESLEEEHQLQQGTINQTPPDTELENKLVQTYLNSTPENVYQNFNNTLTEHKGTNQNSAPTTHRIFQKLGITELIPETNRSLSDKNYLLATELGTALQEHASFHDINTFATEFAHQKFSELWLSGNKGESFKLRFIDGKPNIYNQHDHQDHTAKTINKQLEKIQQKHIQKHLKSIGRA